MPSRSFHVMVKPRGSICNLNCQYCFYLKKENLYPGATFTMSDDLLETFTRQYIESQVGSDVTFAWQGGEPTLMGLDFFRRAVALQKKYIRSGMKIQNALQTNGTLLDDDWCQFFSENQFLVGLSIDGPQALHDTYRQDKGGKSTFARVMKGADLLKKHKVEFNTLTCVNSKNSDSGLEVYRFLRDEVCADRPCYMQFIPIVERDNRTGYQQGNKVTSRSVNAEKYGRFLIDIFDEWIRRDVAKVYVQIFDVSLAAWAGYHPGLCVFEETCGLGLAMEFNGDVYSCDHYVEPRHLLGNISTSHLSELVNSPQQIKFGMAKLTHLPEYCQKCEVRFVCNGGCPKDRIAVTPQNENGLNYLCAGFRSFFNYIDRPMKIMANLLRNNRPPAEIMRILANDPPLSAVQNGSLCPCGSKRKVEDCHNSPHHFSPMPYTARKKR